MKFTQPLREIICWSRLRYRKWRRTPTMKEHHRRICCRCWRISWLINCEYVHMGITDICSAIAEIQWLEAPLGVNPLIFSVQGGIERSKDARRRPECWNKGQREHGRSYRATVCSYDTACPWADGAGGKGESQSKSPAPYLTPSQCKRTFFLTDFKAKPSDWRWTKANWNIWREAQHSARRCQQKCKSCHTVNRPLQNCLYASSKLQSAPRQRDRRDCRHTNNAALQGVSNKCIRVVTL